MCIMSQLSPWEKNIMTTKWLMISLFLARLVTAQDFECLECHEGPDLTKMVDDSTEISISVDPNILNISVHGDLDCIDCHEGITEDHVDGTGILDIKPRAACMTCHEDERDEYVNSIHGLGLARGMEDVASCCDCHGDHDVFPADNPSSRVYHANLPKTCGQCHSRPDVRRRFGRRNLDQVEVYKNSVHGQRLARDPEAQVATCTDCHDYHSILPPVEPLASLNPLNIPETCGKCHQQEKDDYYRSIHWQSLKRGHYESPNCTDCHGEHEIHNAAESLKAGRGSLATTKICANCHSSETLMHRFGLDSRRLESYMRSYHGLAVLKGSPDVATCTSCHEVHAIREQADSLSSVNEANLEATCSRCHEKVTPQFAHIEVHPVDQKSRNPVAWFVRIFYTWLIIVVISAMLIHNLIILLKYIREKRRAELQQIRIHRFQTFEIYQHLLLFFSFTALVVTGFSLKFPDAAWVKLLLYAGMDEAVRSLLHRIAAVIMIVISTVQLGYLSLTVSGRRELKALRPGLEDIKHLWQNMGFYLGLRSTRPQFDRFDYAEKAEYLALIWGVIIMGASGFVLWFPEFFITYLPSWIFETSELIHYYEAWLATLAILVWHWFFVIFHPEKYPLNTTVLDGRISEDDMQHHHPQEYKRQLNMKDEL